MPCSPESVTQAPVSEQQMTPFASLLSDGTPRNLANTRRYQHKKLAARQVNNLVPKYLRWVRAATCPQAALADCALSLRYHPGDKELMAMHRLLAGAACPWS